VHSSLGVNTNSNATVPISKFLAEVVTSAFVGDDAWGGKPDSRFEIEAHSPEVPGEFCAGLMRIHKLSESMMEGPIIANI